MYDIQATEQYDVTAYTDNEFKTCAGILIVIMNSVFHNSSQVT